MFVNNGELLTMNFEYSASRWMEVTHTHIGASTHTHTYTHTHTHIHSHTHARPYIHKQGLALHILVSGISSDGVVYHHSDAFTDGATARVNVTLWKDCIAMSMMCCKREPFISFGNINVFLQIWWSQELNILQESSVALVRFWKVSGRRGRLYQNSNVDIKRVETK